MKHTVVPIFFVFALLISCNTKTNFKQSILTATNLKSTFIALQADSAYILKTPKGAIIKIASNSFGLAGNQKVQLEIKEAYSVQDILLAGLKTESNGKPLKSGGMLYINATANGKSVTLQKPVKISIPGDVYDEKMQLFKGEIENDSSINWVDPQPLDTGLTAKRLAKGLALFKANCASCHKPSRDFTGPALAKCREREPNKEWVYQFMTNCNVMFETDPYAKALLLKYGSKQPQFNLSKEDIKAILDYCDNEAALNPVTAIPANTPVLAQPDSPPKSTPCGYDTVYYPKPDTGIAIIPDDTDLVQPDVITSNNNKEEKNTPPSPLNFTDQSITGGMYDIAINAFGWYNLDYFVEAYPNATPVTLKVQLQMPIESDMNVFLFCPEKRLLTEAFRKDGDIFLFEKDNGTIPLFLNDKAIILAFGSKGDKMFYGTTSFNIKKEQAPVIEIKETTETELKSFIEKNSIDGIKIDLNKKEDFEIQQRPCDGIKTDTVSFSKK